MKKMILIILCGLFFSCAYEKVEKEAPTINIVSPNKKYRINLPENHSDGYIWHLSETYDPSVIGKVQGVWHGNEKGVDFNFNTLASGQTTLTFIQKKYTDTSSIKHFVVKIGIN